MKEHFIKLLSITKMEFIAPSTGGGIGIVAWFIRLAPFIPAIAGITGIVLGILSYRLKKQQAALEMEYKRAQIKHFREYDTKRS